jgi:hypothetical protein
MTDAKSITFEDPGRDRLLGSLRTGASAAVANTVARVREGADKVADKVAEFTDKVADKVANIKRKRSRGRLSVETALGLTDLRPDKTLAPDLNYERSFKAMSVRRFKRRWYGTRTPPAFTALCIFSVLVFFSMGSGILWHRTRSVEAASGSTSEVYFVRCPGLLNCCLAFELLLGCPLRGRRAPTDPLCLPRSPKIM